MHIEAVRESGHSPVPLPGDVIVRSGGLSDLEDAVRLDRLIEDHQAGSPSFSRAPREEDERRASWREMLADPAITFFVVEEGAHIIGHSVLGPAPSDLGIPPDALYLGSTVIAPRDRERGVDRALAAHTLEAAREMGHGSVWTNWRVTNLLASRFWPARGFRPVYQRLHRVIGIG
jgi:ribosomal protein S18 acetylase RimI-like enzyme